MNREKNARHTALAAAISERHNPPYRIYITHRGAPLLVATAVTRDAARVKKRANGGDRGTESWIEKREDGEYGFVYSRVR